MMITRRRKTLFISILAAPLGHLTLQQCVTGKKEDAKTETSSTETPAIAAKKETTVVLESKSGSKAKGKLTLKQTDKGLVLSGFISGLTPNAKHAIHVHEKGDCSAADAASAGAHFNPDNMPHGDIRATLEQKSHAGDLGNIKTDVKGNAKIKIASSVLNMNGANKFSVLGKALVVHEKADDTKSQPAGAAGARIACGVIE